MREMHPMNACLLAPPPCNPNDGRPEPAVPLILGANKALIFTFA
jgi:hypothetical protein